MTTGARFCPRCGGRLDRVPPTVCGACGYGLFVNARPTGGVVVVDRGRFLVLRRSVEPKAGLWELPGGFCDGWEHPSAAAVREAREELGVDVRLGPLIGMYVGCYDFQDEVLPVLDFFWLATIGHGSVSIDRSESSEFGWVDLDDPPPLAFETMDAALRDLKILRSWGGLTV